MTHVKAGQRRRTKTPKVRTGCRTCKIRRVKCDEAQPACKRCTSTGRTCDGYEPPAPTTMTRFVNVLPSHYQPQEVRAFQFFHECTLKQLGTFLQDDFWTSTVLQIANSQQGIWHSVVALSAYHELYLSATPAECERQNKFALRHYNLSIKRILGPNQTSGDAYIHVISCILFICIELLRGNLPAVVGLLKVGYSVLQEARSITAPDDEAACATSAAGSIAAAQKQAHTFFLHLASQLYMLIGKLDPAVCGMADELIEQTTLERLQTTKFRSLYGAQLDLAGIRMEFERFEPGCMPIVSAKLRAWSAAFDAFVREHGADLTSCASKRTITLLDLHRRYFEVDVQVNSTGDAVDQLGWDRHCDKFDDMITLAEAALDVSDLPRQLAGGPQFHMHTGAVPVLYAIVSKCRDPTIRRRAASLLVSRPRQEGSWSSAVVSRVALQAMALEERGLPLQSCSDISAESRVRSIKVVGGYNNQYLVGYETSHGWSWEKAAVLEPMP